MITGWMPEVKVYSNGAPPSPSPNPPLPHHALCGNRVSGPLRERRQKSGKSFPIGEEEAGGVRF